MATYGGTRNYVSENNGYSMYIQAYDNGDPWISGNVWKRSVIFRISMDCPYSYFTQYTIGFEIQVDGTQVAYHNNWYNQTSTSRYQTDKQVCVTDGSFYMNNGDGTTTTYWPVTITYNSNGTKSISVYSMLYTDSASYTPGTISGTVTFDLPTMSVVPSVSQSLASKTNTSITMNWSSDSTCDYLWYSTDNGSNYTAVGSINASSGSYTISGLSANTTYNIKTKLRRTDTQQTNTYSSYTAVTTYQTPSASVWVSSKTSTSITVASSCNVSVSGTYYRIKTSSGNYGNYQASATFSGLSPNTSYTIQVLKVASGSGLSAYSTTSTTTYQTTTASISLSSKTVNSITVTSSCNVTVSSTQYRIKTSNGSYGSYQDSATFTGLSADTSYIVEVKKVASASGESGTATLSVTTYNYGTLSSAPNFDLGSDTTVTYTLPDSSSSYAICICNQAGSIVYVPYRAVTGTSYTFNFTDTELDTLYKLFGNNNTYTDLKYCLRTTCNLTNYYSTSNITLTLTGNQKVVYVGKTTPKRGKIFVKVNGQIKRAVIWTANESGIPKRVI